jgi:hypothetical protein
MTPTPRLRFVERLKITHIDNAGNSTGMAMRILQQWWTVTGTEPEFQDHFGEWRDIPLEKENG